MERKWIGQKNKKTFCFDTFRLMAQQLVKRGRHMCQVLLPFAKGKVSAFSTGTQLRVETIMLTLAKHFMMLGDKGVAHKS